MSNTFIESPNSTQVGDNPSPPEIIKAEMASVPEDADIECGIQHYSADSRRKRIVGGTEATFGEFPWQAYIRIPGHHCGVALLNQYFVITAAHCVHQVKLSDITIFLGEFDRNNTGRWLEPLPEEEFAVVERSIHPEFKYLLTQPNRFDIAILRLHRPVTFKKHILPICLPSKSEDYLERIGVIAGWGKIDNLFLLGKLGTNVLRKVSVPIISINECQEWFVKKNLRVELHNEMFCAGEEYGGMDSCWGDSGGPIIVKDDGRWTLAGIISAGYGCGKDHQPGIYHKTSTTLTWIREFKPTHSSHHS